MTSTSCSLAFQCEYLRLRCETLQAHCQLVRACSSFKTSPPPAIATSLAMTTGQEIHRCSHVLQQVTSSASIKLKSCFGLKLTSSFHNLRSILSFGMSCRLVDFFHSITQNIHYMLTTKDQELIRFREVYGNKCYHGNTLNVDLLAGIPLPHTCYFFNFIHF